MNVSWAAWVSSSPSHRCWLALNLASGSWFATNLASGSSLFTVTHTKQKQRLRGWPAREGGGKGGGGGRLERSWVGLGQGPIRTLWPTICILTLRIATGLGDSPLASLKAYWSVVAIVPPPPCPTNNYVPKKYSPNG